MQGKLTVRDILNQFGYRQLVGNDESLNRIINQSSTNRPGLELTGYFQDATNRIIILGDREMDYINTNMDTARQQYVFDFLTRDEIPMILISRDLPCPQALYDVAYSKNFPVFSSYASTSTLVVELASYLEEYFAAVQTYHGVLLNVYGHGVLITGESSVGKSEIALELIKRGHVLIADDRVDIYRAHNRIYGKAPELLEDMLELRGVGIVNVKEMFGYMATDQKTSIECVVDLVRYSQDREYDRLGLENQAVMNFFGIDLPKIVIPVREGRSIAAIIEAAVTSVIMRNDGYDSAAAFHDKYLQLIEKNRKENES